MRSPPTVLADIASEVAQTLHAMPRVKPPKAKPPVPLPLEAVYAQIRNQEVVLRVQQLVRLRKAEGIRRFEVLLRHMVDGEETSPERVMQTAANHGLASMIDRRVIGELIAWLHRNPAVWKKDPPAFSVNLSDAAVVEAHFISFVESCLQKSGLPPGLIGSHMPFGGSVPRSPSRALRTGYGPRDRDVLRPSESRLRH